MHFLEELPFGGLEPGDKIVSGHSLNVITRKQIQDNDSVHLFLSKTWESPPFRVMERSTSVCFLNKVLV